MRRLAGAVLATTLLLAGCSGGGDDAGEASPTPAPTGSAAADAPAEVTASPEDVAALEAVQVEGELGAAPTLTFDQPFEVTADVARVASEGEGDALEDGQEISMHYIAVSGADGSELGSTWSTDEPQTLTLGDETIVPSLGEALAGQNVGARILFARPGAPAVEATDEAPAQEAVPSTILAIEIVGARTLPTRAEGEAVEPAAGLPVVTLAENGEPTIEVPEGTAEPAELVVQPLIRGTGPVVEAGQNITVHYKGTLFDGTVFDTSWSGAPFPTPIGQGQLIAGWDEGLVGQTVGSQVLLVVPPEKGYGAEGMGDIPADATLIFVVDILAAQ